MPAKRPSRPKEPVAVALPAPQANALPEAVGWWKILGLLLSLVQPAAGLILALLYWPSLDPKTKGFARWCLALAVLGMIFSGAAEGIEQGMGAGEWMIQPY